MTTYTALHMSFLSLFIVGYCYDDICRSSRCIATQSSTRAGLPPGRMIDGNTQQSFAACSHTGEEKSEAWAMVDLGKRYSLYNIVIYYRNEDFWKPFRFRQYSLDVSNSSASQQWSRCYKDNTIFPAVPASIQNISCEIEARYVRIMTTYDAREDNPINGPVLEICEIKVYGCNISHFGPFCSPCGPCKNCNVEYGCPVTCSQNCNDNQCDGNGNCAQGCNHGYWGDRCLNVCPSNCSMKVCNMSSGICNSCNAGYYGSFCNMSCSENCAQSSCSRDGSCIGGCKPNWAGNRCNECDSNHYGHSCSQECSVNCLGQVCNNVTGICSIGCKNGFYSQTCDRICSTTCPSACNRYSGECEGECSVGKYGSQCDQTCSIYCKNGCSRTSGLCDFGCISGRYGADCLRFCSSGCVSDCRQVDGGCVCIKGWQGQYCDECSQNRYGPHCDQECSPVCLNGTCFSNNGSCKEGCNINFHYGKVTQQSSENNSTSNLSSTALYVVTAVLFMSIVLNIFFIVRNVRKTIYKSYNSKDVQKQQNTTQDLNKTTDNVDDNAGYQELGQFSQASHYDKLK